MKRGKQISYNRPDAVEVLPESPELEKAVLGALVLESDQLPDVAEIVEISAFHTPNNGKIYGTERPGDDPLPGRTDQRSRFRR